jgi:chemotaxis protein CheD
LKTIAVDIADLKVSSDPDSALVTYALGSCIGVMLYEPNLRIGGLIHYMLPLSSLNAEKARDKPAMFADSGVPLLFESMYRLGCKKENLVVTVAGGGQLQDKDGVFNIGKRNYTILRKLFWKNGVMVTAEDVGGDVSRTVWLYIATGRVVIRSQGKEVDLCSPLRPS